MLLEVDAKALEWRVAAQLSQDKVMIGEVLDGVDPHETIRQVVFGGKVERVIAKQYNFRMIYFDETGGGYAYYADPKMPDFSRKKWDRIVEGFLSHYDGLYGWHQSIYREVCRTGELRGITGRIWKFDKVRTSAGDGYKRATVYNYPVQGTASDIIRLAGYRIRKEIPFPTTVKIINCVHDSLIFDVMKKDLDRLVEIVYNAFHTLDKEMGKWFSIDWGVPLGCEIKVGNNWQDMKEVTP